MALVVKDRVQETTVTVGTIAIVLAGAVSGFQSFSVIGNGNTTYYAIVGGTEWEVGIGTYTLLGTTLSRDTILSSSNGGSAVNFSVGTKNVFVTYPADKSIYDDAAGNVIGLGTPASVTLTNATGLPLSTGVTGTLPIANGGTGTTSTTYANLTTNVTGTLPVANGGTGATTLTANNVLLGNGTSAPNFVAPGTSGNVLSSNGTTWISAAGGGLTIQSVQTTGFTAVASNIYPCNTTSGTFTVTLPASPSAGNQIQIIDYAGTFATNSIVVNRNGSKIIGVSSNYALATNRESVILTYIDVTQGWVVSSAAYTTTPLTNVSYSVSYVVVAGGAGGASGSGGGGAGGYITGTATVTANSVYTATVGAGGNGGVNNAAGTNGSNSSFTGATTAVGGGTGGGREGSGASGGSGGGGGVSSSGRAGGAGTSGQGNAGGSNNTSPSNYGSGGGGGASAVGANGTSSSGGNGGAGTASSITGSSVTYAGGGGGSVLGAGTEGTGGAGGGGNGGNPGTAGAVNTGGGGGGGRSDASSTAGAGGSGVVILSVATASYSGTTTGSPTITTSGANTVIKFTASGTYTA